jgi:hypothetical protein
MIYHNMMYYLMNQKIFQNVFHHQNIFERCFLLLNQIFLVFDYDFYLKLNNHHIHNILSTKIIFTMIDIL